MNQNVIDMSSPLRSVMMYIKICTIKTKSLKKKILTNRKQTQASGQRNKTYKLNRSLMSTCRKLLKKTKNNQTNKPNQQNS